MPQNSVASLFPPAAELLDLWATLYRLKPLVVTSPRLFPRIERGLAAALLRIHRPSYPNSANGARTQFRGAGPRRFQSSYCGKSIPQVFFTAADRRGAGRAKRAIRLKVQAARMASPDATHACAGRSPSSLAEWSATAAAWVTSRRHARCKHQIGGILSPKGSCSKPERAAGVRITTIFSSLVNHKTSYRNRVGVCPQPIVGSGRQKHQILSLCEATVIILVTPLWSVATFFSLASRVCGKSTVPFPPRRGHRWR